VLYAMRAPWLHAGDGDGELRRSRKRRMILDERTEAWCRERYGRWLEERRGGLFGKPLEHGDEAGASGLDGPAETATPESETGREDDDRDQAADPSGHAQDAPEHETNSTVVPIPSRPSRGAA
jgi:hypothetical protein